MKIYNLGMEDIDYEQSTKTFESEYDSWLQAKKIIQKIQWESQYYTYLASIEYKKKSQKTNMKEIMNWYVAETKQEERLCNDRKWARQKTEDILNVIFARIECQLPLPKDEL
jgi:hypothetical protein